MEHGVKKEFHTNGKLRSTTECVNDLNHGIEKVYYENGNLKMEMMWFEGYPHGSITLYNEQGAILKQGQMFMGAFVESPVVIPTESTKPSTTPKTGNTKK
jgi:antitoxin component YwqK of YwqJK toxin-antitoxin module